MTRDLFVPTKFYGGRRKVQHKYPQWGKKDT